MAADTGDVDFVSDGAESDNTDNSILSISVEGSIDVDEDTMEVLPAAAIEIAQQNVVDAKKELKKARMVKGMASEYEKHCHKRLLNAKSAYHAQVARKEKLKAQRDQSKAKNKRNSDASPMTKAKAIQFNEEMERLASPRKSASKMTRAKRG